MEVSLNHLRPGMDGVVESVWGCDALCCRFRGLGVIPGSTLRCLGKSRNGQVTILQVAGMRVRMQTRDLEKIRVRV